MLQIRVVRIASHDRRPTIARAPTPTPTPTATTTTTPTVVVFAAPIDDTTARCVIVKSTAALDNTGQEPREMSDANKFKAECELDDLVAANKIHHCDGMCGSNELRHELPERKHDESTRESGVNDCNVQPLGHGIFRKTRIRRQLRREKNNKDDKELTSNKKTLDVEAALCGRKSMRGTCADGLGRNGGG